MRALGLVLLLAFCACASPAPSPAPAPSGPNVVLISVDTLGAGHLPCYGYERETSPNLCALADECLFFDNAYSTSAKTAESHMTMFTSLYPSVHGVKNAFKKKDVRTLGEEITTLAETLEDHGYRTVGFHSGGMLEGRFGFDRGFDVYERAVLSEAVDWLRDSSGRRPFFFFFHSYRVHDPYTPGAPFDTLFDPDYEGGIDHGWAGIAMEDSRVSRLRDGREFWKLVDKEDPADVAHVSALYDGAIVEFDRQLAELLDAVDRYAPGSIVIVLSDHGEEFMEHGRFRHQQLYNEILRVPLLICHPDLSGATRVEHDVSLVDLAPTILDMLSLPVPAQYQGKPLLRNLEPVPGDGPIFGEIYRDGMQTVIRGDR